MRETVGGLRDHFDVQPANEPSRKWTLGESKWFSTHWRYDRGIGDEREGTSKGTYALDKSVTGEYVLVRPPKKPGGLWEWCLALLVFWITVERVESRKDMGAVFDGTAPETQVNCESSLDETVRSEHCLGKAFLLFLLLGLFASRRKSCEFCKKFLLGLHLVEPYECALEIFLAKHKIQQKNYCTAQWVLWNKLIIDTLHSLEGNLPALMSLTEDSEVRVEQFFVRVEEDIDKLLVAHPSHRENVFGLYITKSHELNKARSLPVFEIDAGVWFRFLWLVVIVFFDKWRVCLDWVRQLFAVCEWVRTALVFICEMLAVKLLLHLLWDRRHALVEVCLGVKLRISQGIRDKYRRTTDRFRHFGDRVREVVSRVVLCLYSGMVGLCEGTGLKFPTFVSWLSVQIRMRRGLDNLGLKIKKAFGNNSIWNSNVCFGRVVSSKEAGENPKDEARIGAMGAESDCCRTKDECTVATAAESMEGVDTVSAHSSASSCVRLECGNGSSEQQQWSIVVNGTRYLGHLRSGEMWASSSVGPDYTGEETSAVSGGETTKERNRRLLLQHRKHQQRAAKVRRRKRKTECSLHVIEEEGVTTGTLRDSAGEDHDFISSEIIVMRQDIVSFLRRRRTVSRRGVRNRGKGASGVRRTSPIAKIRWVGWFMMPQAWVRVIQLYSCSASRYLMFGSNRRYKPGD